MFYDAQRNVVVYHVSDPAAFIKWVPGAGQLRLNGYVYAPASLETLQAIRSLGLPVLEPMRDYDWPHGIHIKAPMHAQVLTANFMAVHPRCFCLSDPGTGKTLAALWAADYMMGQAKERFRALVVAPLSSLRDTWETEINANFLGRRTCAILHGPEKKRMEQLNENVDFYIINHDGIKVGVRRDPRKGFQYEGFAAALAERRDIRLAIIDEASAFRESNTARSRIARALLSPRNFVWEITGTPTPNGPEDAHGLRKLLTPWWGETKTSWRSRTMTQVSTYKWLPRPGAAQLVKDTLQPAIRFTLEECVDLPPMITQTREVELTPEQKDKLRELKRECLLNLKDGSTISAVNEAAMRSKFLQIVSGAVYDDAHNAHFIPCEPRLKVLREVIEESNDKLILFAPFTSVVRMLSEKLKDIPHAVITGAVKERDRADIFSDFRGKPEPRMIIADPGTMSHSLNLTISKTVVWWTPKDHTEIYLQANRRIRRPGQDKTQRIVHLVGHHIERDIFQRLADNRDLQGVMLSLVEQDR